MPSLIAIALSFVVAGSSATADVPDGLYEKPAPGTQPRAEVPLATGAAQPIGARFAAPVMRADLRSVDNANTRFHLSLDLAREPRLISTLPLVLVIDGRAHAQSSGGTAASNDLARVSFEIPDRETADRAAAHFGTTPLLRRHPGHQLLVTFEPEARTSTEPILVTMRITNVGSRPITFFQGGRNRGDRDNQFTFSARMQDRQVADIGSSLHFGGLGGLHSIEPGGEFAHTIDLEDWFAFDQPGVYELLGSYAMEFFDPDGDTWLPLWEDYASAAFTIRIEGR